MPARASPPKIQKGFIMAYPAANIPPPATTRKQHADQISVREFLIFLLANKKGQPVRLSRPEQGYAPLFCNGCPFT